ncbi:hypothetical protein U9M48_006145 [Paspalum notatum var. saurae]|uniref:Integrase catalytic domain-containing protein n=1 Tax=Paspalum notatum var. saurae TaxID=547442 RepID=A0AAQ3PTR3_PASNO
MEPRKKILDEAHTSMFTLHPGSNKMYQDLKQKFWWTRMKREIAKYVYECDFPPEVGGYTHGLHRGIASHTKGYDSIWVIIDRFTKSAHFIPVKTTYRAKQYAELYISRIVSLHGVPLTITSDRGSPFLSRFGSNYKAAPGTNLIHEFGIPSSNKRPS